MALQFETVAIAFTQGLDTRNQRKLVVPGKWDDLLNFTLSEDNTPRLRDGHQELVATANGNGLATYNEELLTLSGGYVYSVSTAAENRNLVTGRRGYVDVSKSEVARGVGNYDTPDCATGGGFTCYVWTDKNSATASLGVSVILVDEATGTQVIQATRMRTTAGVKNPRVVYSGSTFFIFYRDAGGGVEGLYCRLINIATPTTLGAETNIVLSANFANKNIDATPWIGGGDEAQVVYGWSDGVTSVRTLTVDSIAGVPTLNLGPTNVFTEVALPVATLTGLAVCGFSGNGSAGIFATSTGAAALAGLAGATVDDLLTVVTTTQIDNAVAATTSAVHITACVNDDGATQKLQVFWDRPSEWAINGLNPLKTVRVDAGLTGAAVTLLNSATFAVAANAAAGPKGPFIAGKAFRNGTTVFLPVYVGSTYWNIFAASSNPRNSNTQNTFFLLELLQDGVLPQQFNVVAKAMSGSYGLLATAGNPPETCTPCSVFSPSSGVFVLLATEKTTIELSAGGNDISRVGLVRLVLTPKTATPPCRVQLGETTLFAGGSLSAYDGAQVVEQGFPLYPEGPGVVANGGGTGVLTAGVHQIVFVYEWIDNAGQRHQSAPSLPTTKTAAANDSFTCAVPTLLMSGKGGSPSVATGVQIVAYMTIAGGLVFYRVITSLANNSLAATTVAIAVSESDAILAGNEILYTQPNQSPTTLANIAPPPCNSICVAQNRLFFDIADQPFQFGYSQEYINNVGLQFSPDLVARVPADSGGIVALAVMDEKIIIFGANKIYVMLGSGPTPSGGFNNYSQPQDIQSDVGCSEARSVLSGTPGGIIFKSKKGFMLLQRDLSVKYIGEGVARFDSNIVTAATLLADEYEARFVVSGSNATSMGTFSGFTLVYSYLLDQWSYFCKTAGLAYEPVDAMWWGAAGGGEGRYVTISLANGLNQDTPGVYIDRPGLQATVGITTGAQTAWLHLSKLEGFQRIRKIYLTGTAIDFTVPASTLTIHVMFDDDYQLLGANNYSFAINMATVFPGSGTKAIDLRHKLRHQKCKSVAFKFVETTAGGIRTIGIQALALEVGVKKGVNRLPAGQSVG